MFSPVCSFSSSLIASNVASALYVLDVQCAVTARRALQFGDVERSNDRWIWEHAVLRSSLITSFASLKYLKQSERMVLPLWGSLLSAVLSRYWIILRNDSASTSLNAWRRSIIYSTMSFLNTSGSIAGLIQASIVGWSDDNWPSLWILCVLRWYTALEVVAAERFVEQYLHCQRRSLPTFSRSPCFQIHDVVILDLVDFDVSGMISSLLKVHCWLDGSFGSDIRLDWLDDLLNRGWIGGPFGAFRPSSHLCLTRMLVFEYSWVCINVGEWVMGFYTS